MSGGAYTDSAREFLAGGAHRYVEKPFAPEALRALLADPA